MRSVLVVMLVAGCTIDTGDAQSQLVLTRDDGTRIEMPPNTETFAYCEAYDPPYHTERAIKIFHGNRFDGASWSLSAVRADISRGEIVTFPISFTTTEPARGVVFFVNDDADDNEAASDQPGSTGTISFASADCGGFVELSIGATLGSESGGPPITVQGSFRAPVGAAPG